MHGVRAVCLWVVAISLPAAAQIQFVQTIEERAPAGAPSTSVTVTLPQLSSPGDLVIVATSTDSDGGVVSVLDDQENAYERIIGPVMWAAQFQTELWVAKNIQTGATRLSVTVTQTAPSVNVFIVYANEYSGLDPDAPLDQMGVAVGTGSDPIQSPTRTTRFPNELIFGHTEGSFWEVDAVAGWNVCNTAEINSEVDKVVATIGDYDVPSVFADGGSSQWIATILTFTAPHTSADAGGSEGGDAGGPPSTARVGCSCAGVPSVGALFALVALSGGSRRRRKSGKSTTWDMANPPRPQRLDRPRRRAAGRDTEA